MSRTHHSPPPSVLDEAQLRRIQATHRGFLYQHLYAAGCMLVATRCDFREILVERDEDIEIRTPEGHTYIQVKTRSEPLVPSDIDSAMERFAEARKLHNVSGATSAEDNEGRTGVPCFIIVANVPPGPKLSGMLESAAWPSDVRVMSPRDPGSVDGFPPAWPDLEAAFTWCAEEADRIPYTRVVAETLVWKLAALTQAAAAGGVGTNKSLQSFRTDDLPRLFEQVVTELQEMPPPPEPYWPHQDEPTPVRDTSVRLITGPTGSGKTAWASVAAAHDARPQAYFSAHGAEGSGFVPALVRELAARFAGRNGRDISSVIMPGQSGLDALRALSILLREDGPTPVVFVDDVQVLEAKAVLRAIQAAPTLKWVLLGHPGPTVDQIAARLEIEPEPLNGWALSTIATAVDSLGCAADAPTCERVQVLTGGLPLFVRSMATTALKTGAGLAELCDQLEHGDHLEKTAQEVLLADTLSALDAQERRLAEVLGIAGISLRPEELIELAAICDVPSESVAPNLRSLLTWGVGRRFREDQVRIHDAFRVLCNGTSGLISAGTVQTLKKRLVDLLAAGMPTQSVQRGGRFLELLPEVGATEQLVEIVANGSEQLQELGLAPRLKSVLNQVVCDPSADAGARFWAADALAFWAIQEGQRGRASELVEALDRIAGEMTRLDERQELALLFKKLLFAGREGDTEEAKSFYDEIARSSEDEAVLRTARYDYAIALFSGEEFDEAANAAWNLGLEYYDVVGLDPAWVYRRNPPEIAARFSGSVDVLDDLKRLADCLDLYSRARRAQGMKSGLARIHATKFYTVSGAYRSAVRSGQDVVDDMIAMGDLREARGFMEQTLIPSVVDLGLTDYLVPVRAQYAVVLAYDGEIQKARAELEALRSFRAASSYAQVELQNQAALVEAIAAGQAEAPPRRQLPPAPPKLPLRTYEEGKKVGRNDPCPCGSGLKFKKCCGP